MSDPAVERVRSYIARLPFRLELLEFEEDTSTAELAARAVGVEVGQIAKSVLFVGKKKAGAVLVVTSGDVRIDQRALKAVVREKMSMASEEDCVALTGFCPGGICPFAVGERVRVLVDSSMKRFPVVYAAGGSPHSAVPVTVEQLLAACGAELVNVCEPQT